MNRLSITMLVMPILILLGSTASASDAEKTTTSKEQTRRLIYCAEFLTHEERESYRARMRAAGGQKVRAEIREAHREEMRDRIRKSGKDPQVCEPARYRLRLRGGQHESAE